VREQLQVAPVRVLEVGGGQQRQSLAPSVLDRVSNSSARAIFNVSIASASASLSHWRTIPAWHVRRRVVAEVQPEQEHDSAHHGRDIAGMLGVVRQIIVARGFSGPRPAENAIALPRSVVSRTGPAPMIRLSTSGVAAPSLSARVTEPSGSMRRNRADPSSRMGGSVLSMSAAER
jgi:hypothetical protein